MVTPNKEAQVNILSNSDEASEDRGPLIEDEELATAKTIIEGKAKEIGTSSADDVLAFLEADDVEESEEEVYSDFRIPLARDTRPMLAAWHEYKAAMAQVKTSYKLWKIETEDLGGGDEDQRRESIVQNASRIKKSLDAIEIELKDALPKLRGVSWITRSEIILMPVWMHDLAGITITVTDAERIEAESALQERRDGANSSE